MDSELLNKPHDTLIIKRKFSLVFRIMANITLDVYNSRFQTQDNTPGLKATSTWPTEKG